MVDLRLALQSPNCPLQFFNLSGAGLFSIALEMVSRQRLMRCLSTISIADSASQHLIQIGEHDRFTIKLVAIATFQWPSSYLN